jgi:hypothetical protein
MAHNTVHRMASALRPLLKEYKELLRFHEERTQRQQAVERRSDPADILSHAIELIGGGVADPEFR